MSQFPAALKPKEEDIAKMLACSVHIGTKNLEQQWRDTFGREEQMEFTS
jgi:hypothetical protein